MDEGPRLLVLRYDPELGCWVVDEDSAHHLEEFAAIVGVVMLEVTEIAPMTKP